MAGSDHMKPLNVGIIPARGGSKGVPGKNLRLLNGHPLIYYGIECSRKSADIDLTIVTTDCQEIAATAEELGARVIMRNPEHAQDSSPTEPAMQEVVESLEKEGHQIGYVVLLQCTCPFRLVQDVTDAFAILKDTDGDAVMSVSEVPGHFHPYWQKRIAEDGSLASMMRDPEVEHAILETSKYWRRQDLPGTYYWKNGAIYIMSRDSLMVAGHRYGTKCMPLVMDAARLANIDTEEDFRQAEALISKGLVTLDF